MKNNIIDKLYLAIQKGEYQTVLNNKNFIQQAVFEIITSDKIFEPVLLFKIIDILNKIYNETTYDSLIDDDDYDILVNIYYKQTGQFPIGSTTRIHIYDSKDHILSQPEETDLYIQFPDTSDMIYRDYIIPPDERILGKHKHIQPYDEKLNKSTSSEQLAPNMVGSLSKCKYVLVKDLDEDSKNEDVFERDFIQKHIKDGLYNFDRNIRFLIQLKYDGISVVAKIKDGVIIEATSRGDTSRNKAVDLTPILYGYTFDEKLPEEFSGLTVTVKFEAIMTNYDLQRYNQMTESKYKNSRTGITSIFGRLNGRKFQNLITLVPLDMDTGDDIIPLDKKLAHLNKYYANTIKNEGVVGDGSVPFMLYSVHKFYTDASLLKGHASFMYDGIVFTYLDDDIVENLGRSNSINNYQTAIKFKADTKYTRFIGYTYTIGKDGRITPMINYEKIIFIGTYHTKSSGHSYGRFKELNLAKGDIIKVKYENDVMPYVYKYECEENNQNPNKPEEFITHCPYCKSKLVVSDSGKSIFCPNVKCYGRNIKRLAGFFKTLDIRDFDEGYLESLRLTTLHEIFNVDKEYVAKMLHSDILAEKFMINLKIGLTDRWDYELFAALGFTSLGTAKWKKIFETISPHELVKILKENKNKLYSLKIDNIGQSTINTIINEYPVFATDIETILELDFKEGKNFTNRKKVRFTGVRDKELVNKLNKIGFDASGSLSVAKDTDILVVPNENHDSDKVRKAKKYGIQIIPINELRNNPDKYI